MGCDLFRIDHGFIGGDVEMQVWLVNAPKATQRGPQCRASSLAALAGGLAAAISIIIPRPLVHTMTDRDMRRMAPPIARPLVGIERRAGSGDVLHEQGRAGVPIGMVPPQKRCSPVSREMRLIIGGRSLAQGPCPRR